MTRTDLTPAQAAAIAAHRFGLTEPQLQRVGMDAAGWLLAQIGPAEAQQGSNLVSGAGGLTKSGTSTYRFGSAGGTAFSDNTWFGALTINDGTIRFNNNADTAPTALRANPVVLNSATALLTTQFKALGTAAGQDPDSSLRFGTLGA